MAHPQHKPSQHDLELLSAYMDGELSAREKGALEQRLIRETALRKELDDLRATAALVGDLPRLKAPRDFTLDPSLHRLPRWRRLFSFGSTLELAGALGTVLSIVVIALAIALSQQPSMSRNERRSEQEAANVAQRGTNTPATSRLETATAEGTSIVYAGEGFQSTMAMQSTVYAGTPLSSPSAAPARTLAVTPTPLADTLNAPQEFAEVAPEAASEIEQPAPGVSVGAAAAPPPAPSRTSTAPQTSSAFDGSAASSGAEPAQAPIAASQAVADTGADTGYAGEEAAGGGVPPAGALRESPDTDDNTTTSDEAGRFDKTASAPTAETVPQEIAQIPTSTSSEKSQSAQGETGKRDVWWLVALGAVLLVFSVTLNVIGRRKIF